MLIHQYQNDAVLPGPDSPPGMTTSKSSKSSSFHSGSSGEDASVVADGGHFEEIGLDDDHGTPKGHSLTKNHHLHHHHHHSHQQQQYQHQHGFHQPQRNGVRSAKRPPLSPSANSQPFTGRTLISTNQGLRPRRSSPNLASTLSSSNPRSTSLTALSNPHPMPLVRKHSATSLHLPRHRTPSPGLTSDPCDPSHSPRPRRGSWQSNSDKKSIAELEDECDDDEEEDIPNGIVLDNVPLSPRPPHDRPPSRGPSPTTPREPSPKPRVRSIGNGTPAVAQAQGSLRSPSWKTDAITSDRPPMLKQRARSWNLAHAELNAEARALTEKLEEHATEVEEGRLKRPNTWNPSRRASADHTYQKRERVKSTPELPPLRKTNIMIDPLPVSKEKEAVLSRTRPSWLPPKDPAEERRHLKEYQKMMAASAKADERREAARRVKVESRDHAVDNSMQAWEKDILARWDVAIRERRTREMWWKGIAPRSRGPVWMRAIGNELGLTNASYEAALSRARDVEDRVKYDKGDAEDHVKMRWMDQIRKDASHNTWRDLRIFQMEGPLHQGLVDVLSAYAMYRNDIGYVSGCNTITALLLLNLPNPESAFIALANILNRPLPLSFYTSDPGAQSSAYNLVLQTLSKKSPKLHKQLTEHIPDLEPAFLLKHVFLSLFTGFLAIDEAARLWDVYVFEGDQCLVWAAVALLLRREMSLLGTRTKEEVVAILEDTHSTVASARPAGEQGSEDKLIAMVRETSRL